jgi:hypothetical protein
VSDGQLEILRFNFGAYQAAVTQQSLQALAVVAAVGSSSLHGYMVVQNLMGSYLIKRNHPELPLE